MNAQLQIWKLLIRGDGNSMSDLFSLKGKVALVTGGAGHLGLAMSEVLAAYGATVYIASRNESNNIKIANNISRKTGSKVLGIQLNNLNIGSVNHTVSTIIENEGKIDILINNSYAGKTGELLTGSEYDWMESFDGSIYATYRMIKSVLPHMLEQKKGSIINIASMYGIVSPNPEIYGSSMQNNPPHYGAAKAGIIQFTKYLAGHFGNQGIRTNCISPGPFPNKETQKNKEFVANLAEKNPMKRIGYPEELKGITLLLASDASSYINGQNICVDGGWTIW